MLEKLKGLTAEKMDTVELIELATVGTGAIATCKAHELPVPAWLDDSMKAANAELSRRRADMLAARKRELEGTLTSLRTRDERVADATAELARINAQLGT